MIQQVDKLIDGGSYITMDPARRVLRDGALAISSDRIVAIGKREEILGQYEGRERIEASRRVVTPGFVNSHVHFYHTMHRGLAPDNLDGSEWSNYVHDNFAPVITGEDEVWWAYVTLLDILKTGTTTFLAAGSYHPEVVLDTLSKSGVRGFEGRRTYDQVDLSHASLIDSTETSIKENQAVMRRYASWLEESRVVQPAVNVVGLGRVTDELFVASKNLADHYGAIFNFHECAFPQQVKSVTERAGGKSPIKRLYDLGVLDSNCVLAHMVHVADDEIPLLAETGASVAHNPGTALKIVYGLSRGGKFPEMLDAGVNVALGTDAADCANFMDMVRAMYLASVLFKDIRSDPRVMGVETALEMATINGAKAVGMADEIGSLEPGKKADIVLFDTDRPEWQPLHCEPYNLVLSASGDSADTVIVDGRVLMQGREVKTIDERAVMERMRHLGPEALKRSGAQLPTRWPVV